MNSLLDTDNTLNIILYDSFIRLLLGNSNPSQLIYLAIKAAPP